MGTQLNKTEEGLEARNRMLLSASPNAYRFSSLLLYLAVMESTAAFTFVTTASGSAT